LIVPLSINSSFDSSNFFLADTVDTNNAEQTNTMIAVDRVPRCRKLLRAGNELARGPR
jgi:hypothetical protein